MLDFEIFGFTPFKFMLTMVSDVSLWTLIFGGLIIMLLLSYANKLGVFHLVGSLIRFVIKTVRNIIATIWFVISQGYMLIMFHVDSRNKNYDSAEYWATRKLTIEGIKCIDFTGTQPLLIQHAKAVSFLIEKVLIIKRVINNILNKVFFVTKP